jgi:ubiquinone/menaquinone biosynthesis C-methylase UbiE
MAEIVGRDGRVFAVDSDERSIKSVGIKAANKGNGVVVAQRASAAQLDGIADHSLDFILSNLVLCCMSDHSGGIREIKRTLKPSGSAYVSVVRFGRSRKKPNLVGKLEWRSILQEFKIVDQGTTLRKRWALVTATA